MCVGVCVCAVYIYVYIHICIYFTKLHKKEDTENVSYQGCIDLANRNEKWDEFPLQKFHLLCALD